MAHDWSSAAHGLNQLLVNPGVDYGYVHGFSYMLPPGSCMAELDFQNCLLRWLVSPLPRRSLGVRHPVSGLLGMSLFLPFGFGPSPGRNDGCAKEVLRIAGKIRPPLRRDLLWREIVVEESTRLRAWPTARPS